MSEDLSRYFADAMQAASGDDPWSQLRRASLQSLAAQVPDLAPARPLPLTMHMVDPESEDNTVPAAAAGEMLERLQRAVARVAKARRTHAIEVKRLFKADVAAARLDVLTAVPGSWIVELRPHLVQQPADDEEEQAEIPLGTSTWAEQAMVEILAVLPEGPEDEAALDAIAVAEPVIRRAVTDLVSGRGQQLDVGFSLERPQGEPLAGRITTDQARALRRALDIESEERIIETRRGRLDGLRTKRRIFYLEVPGGQELHGLVDEDLLPVVRDNLDRVVNVRLEVVISRSKSGRVSQRRYHLVGVDDFQQPTLLDESNMPPLPGGPAALPGPPRELPPGSSS
jgi:hypothetical protein